MTDETLLSAIKDLGEKAVIDELYRRLNCSRQVEEALRVHLGAVQCKAAMYKSDLTNLRRELTKYRNQVKFLVEGMTTIGEDSYKDDSEGVRILLKDMERKLSKREFDPIERRDD